MPTQVIERLTSGLSEGLVYAAIALVALVGLLKCIYPVFRNSTLLNRAVMKLERGAGEGRLPVWQEPRFLGRSLRGEWQRFLMNAGQLEQRGMPCDTMDYINEDTVIYKPGHAQLAELIPGLLTSLGILGTFLGLMEGLTSLDFGNAESTIESIPALLGGMRFAFATSVAGIACSLVFNMLNRIIVGRAFKALDTFEEAFYELAMPRPLDPDVQLMCQKQDEEASLQKAAESVGSHIAGMLEMSISRAMQPLTLSLDTFIKGMTGEQVEGVQRIVSQFVAQMNAAMDGQMTALSETMRAVNQGQLQTQKNLQHSLATAEMLAADANRIQEASHTIALQMQELSEKMRKEQEAQLRAGELAAEAISQPLYAQSEALTQSLMHMRAAIDELAYRMDYMGSQPGMEDASYAQAQEDVQPLWQTPPTLVKIMREARTPDGWQPIDPENDPPFPGNEGA